MVSLKEAIVGMWVDRRGDCGRFYDSMVANGFSKTDVVNDILALAVLSTVELSHSAYIFLHSFKFLIALRSARPCRQLLSR